MAVELLPCPWCGGRIVESVSEGTTFRWRKVDGCCADGPEVRHDTMADDQAAAEMDSHSRAIDAWNERHPATTAEPTATVEGAIHALDRLDDSAMAGNTSHHPDDYDTVRGAITSQAAEVAALRAEVAYRDNIINGHAADTREYQKHIAAAQRDADGLRALLREAAPFVGWTGAPDGLNARIDAALEARP